MLHVQPPPSSTTTATTTAISPPPPPAEPPTDCIPKWSLEGGDNDAIEQQDYHRHAPPPPPPPPPITEDDEYFFLNQPPPPPPPAPPSMLLAQDDDDYDDEETVMQQGPPSNFGLMMVDDKYETATRIFYATMQKFAQNNCIRRTFLENWHLHSMYSKSQQVLLGIPNAQSMVYLSGDDFMFTPQLVPQDAVMMDRMEFDWEDDDDEDREHYHHQQVSTAAAAAAQAIDQEQGTSTYMDYNGGGGDDDDDNGVLVMSAPAPVMNENMWMAPDKTYQDASGISLDAVDLYRNGSPSPPFLPPLDSNEKGKETLRLPAPEDSGGGVVYTSAMDEKHEPEQHEQEDTKITQGLSQQSSCSSACYGAVMRQHRSPPRHSITTSQHPSFAGDMTDRMLQWPILSTSDRIARDLLLAFELAEHFVDNNKRGLRTVSSFFVYLIRIWYVLFVCAEMVLGSVGARSHYRRRRPLTNDELV